jgi:hypothetical protein
VILALLFPLAVACSSEPAESSIEREARAARGLTVPPAVRGLDVSNVEHVNSTIQVSWEFQTTWSSTCAG